MITHTVHTDTNSADDSEGAIFGFKGNDFLPFVGSMIVSIIGIPVTSSMASLKDAPDEVRWLVAFIPTIITTGYLIFFRMNRPAGFQHDFFDMLINGADFHFLPQWGKAVNPIEEEKKKVAKRVGRR